MRTRRRAGWVLALAVAMVCLALLGLAARGGAWAGPLAAAESGAAEPPPGPGQVAVGAVLAQAGNCLGCHSLPGRPPGAGGLAIATPFGAVHAGNLTPDPATGLGRWREADFVRALREGISRDGRLLYPAFPYPHFSRLSDDEAGALWAWARSLAPAQQAASPPRLSWPARSPWALAVWRGLFFQPQRFQPEPTQSAEWNRGAFLVQGPGHCGACHDSRHALGAAWQPGRLDGQTLPDGRWHAPSLRDPAQAGVQRWTAAEVVQLLQTGRSPAGRANGPMAEVVRHGTAGLPLADLQAMALYLRQLPVEAASGPPGRSASATGAASASAEPSALGPKLYEQHCAECHGPQGEGAAGVYPPLLGNRLLAQPEALNLARVVMEGGFELATPAHPRPYGMPPYGPLLSDAELAELLSYLRSTWGGGAGPVSSVMVNRWRAGGG